VNLGNLPDFNGTIGAYTTAGATVNPALISELSDPIGIGVVATVPEPSSLTLNLGRFTPFHRCYPQKDLLFLSSGENIE
jgi:hypothetical protein